MFHHIAQETDAYTLWTKMEVMYHSKDIAEQGFADEKASEFEAKE